MSKRGPYKHVIGVQCSILMVPRINTCVKMKIITVEQYHIWKVEYTVMYTVSLHMFFDVFVNIMFNTNIRTSRNVYTLLGTTP